MADIIFEEDQVDEALGVAFHLLMQAVSQLQQAQKVQEQKILIKLQEALQMQEQRFQNMLHIHDLMVCKMQGEIEEEKARNAEALHALAQRLENRIQQLEEKVEIVDRKPPLIVGRKRIEGSGREEQHGRLESLLENLKMDVENALQQVSIRVKKIEDKLEKDVILPTLSFVSCESDCNFSNTLPSSLHASSSHACSPDASNSLSISPHTIIFPDNNLVHPLVKTSNNSTQSLPFTRGCGFLAHNELLQAIREGKIKNVWKLLNEGADTNVRDEKRNTPLHEAVFAGHTNIVCLLLDRGANVNAKNYIDDTPLHFAASEVRTVIISLLVDKNCDVNARNHSGTTALHLTAARDCTGQCISLLIHAGARLESRNVRGSTPLHLAASRGNVTGVRTLLAAGARKDIKNNCEKTPFDLADTDTICDLLCLEPKKK